METEKLQVILTFIAAIMASITVLMAVWVAYWRTLAGWKLYQKSMKELKDNFPSILDARNSYLHMRCQQNYRGIFRSSRHFKIPDPVESSEKKGEKKAYIFHQGMPHFYTESSLFYRFAARH